MSTWPAEAFSIRVVDGMCWPDCANNRDGDYCFRCGGARDWIVFALCRDAAHTQQTHNIITGSIRSPASSSNNISNTTSTRAATTATPHTHILTTYDPETATHTSSDDDYYIEHGIHGLPTGPQLLSVRKNPMVLRY